MPDFDNHDSKRGVTLPEDAADLLTNPIAARTFDDGHRAEVWVMTYGKGRLILMPHADSFDVIDGWCYETLLGAVIALAAWDGEGEPAGWMRHPMSGRRRPGGDPAQEYVRW